MTFIKRNFSSFVVPISLLAMMMMHCLIACSARKDPPNITTDEASLLSLKSHITLDPQNILAANWTNVTSACNWIGVTCSSRHGRVIALNISSMNFTGTIPRELGNLSFLSSLDLSNNKFSGKLPQELANLHRLKFIRVSLNYFNGEVPTWFGLMPNLQILLLRNNSFTGLIPASLSNITNLHNLDLSFNSLQGKIPEEIGNLTKLRTLFIQYCQLTGPIPVTIFNVSTLETIALVGNEFSGAIPQEIGNLQNLQILRMEKNKIGGQIPRTIFNITTLQVLQLSSNIFSGDIPGNLCDHLPDLQRLNLDYNQLEGEIPRQIYKCSSLQILSLSMNQFSGSISRELGNLSMLTGFDFNGNKLTGEIPAEIIYLNKLQVLSLSNNSLTGSIPAAIFNMSTLTEIDLTMNYLWGILPSDLGARLPNLVYLYLNLNNLTGTIPSTISNCSNLLDLILSSNKFYGVIPNSLGNLPVLQRLFLFENDLTSEPSDTGMSFITSLTNCRSLQQLWARDNPLNGIIPISVGNFSTSLQSFSARNCELRGSIPSEIGNLISLVFLDLPGNHLTGEIPSTLENIHGIQALYLAQNQLEGSIPEGLCKLQQIFLLDLQYNQLSGRIPECLSNIASLRRLLLGSNRLNSTIPASLWNLKDLLLLNLTSNFLSGSLPPEIGNLKVLTFLGLSKNQFTNNIPAELGGLKSMVSLIMDNNRLEGSIPESLGNMSSLNVLKLSHNNLSGSIPKSLEAFEHLEDFNVSYNHLKGEIPSNGAFQNLTDQSFLFNDALCGAPRFHVPPCKIRDTSSLYKSSGKRHLRVIFIVAGSAALVLAIILIIVHLKYQRRSKTDPTDTRLPSLIKLERISYYELLRATDGYNENNLLGTGSFGSVYKGVLMNGTVLAIKVFNSQQEAAFKSFDTECEVLRSLRHRNLTKVISSCSNDDFKALILEYMSNGSLDKWLYSNENSLDIVQRLDIMIDVTMALEYLHHGHTTPVAHCDLKPSNILLDEDMVAHVSDFGISKLFVEETNVFTKTFATLGYIAPEYGLEGLVSTRCDIYSFGIVLMETFTRKNPNDEMFAGEFSLRRWVQDSLATSSHVHIVDANLVSPEDRHFTEKMQCITSIMVLAMKCSSESPAERTNMKDVVAALKKIKLGFLASSAGN